MTASVPSALSFQIPSYLQPPPPPAPTRALELLARIDRTLREAARADLRRFRVLLALLREEIDDAQAVALLGLRREGPGSEGLQPADARRLLCQELGTAPAARPLRLGWVGRQTDQGVCDAVEALRTLKAQLARHSLLLHWLLRVEGGRATVAQACAALGLDERTWRAWVLTELGWPAEALEVPPFAPEDAAAALVDVQPHQPAPRRALRLLSDHGDVLLFDGAAQLVEVTSDGALVTVSTGWAATAKSRRRVVLFVARALALAAAAACGGPLAPAAGAKVSADELRGTMLRAAEALGPDGEPVDREWPDALCAALAAIEPSTVAESPTRRIARSVHAGLLCCTLMEEPDLLSSLPTGRRARIERWASAALGALAQLEAAVGARRALR